MIIKIDKVLEKLEDEIDIIKSKLIKTPKMISISDNLTSATRSYLKSQKKIANKYGIDFSVIETDDIVKDLNKYNNDKNIDGIFVSRPLKNKNYQEIDIARLLNPNKDIEGLSVYNMGEMVYENEYFVPCTAESAIKILENCMDLEGKNIVVIGRSINVGKAAAIMLERKNRSATVTITNSRTKNLKELTMKADAVIVAIGKAEYLTKDFIKEGTYIIDVGINFKNGKLFGDVSKNLYDKNYYITPVPGGVGTITSTILMRNVFRAAIKNIKQ